MSIKKFLLLILFTIILSVSASATDFYLPTNCSTIALCLDDMNTSDTLYILDATITESPTINKQVIIDGMSNTTLTGGFDLSVAGVEIKNINISSGISVDIGENQNLKTFIYCQSDNNILKNLSFGTLTGITGTAADSCSHMKGGRASGIYCDTDGNILENLNFVGAITAGTGGYCTTNDQTGGAGGDASVLYLSDSSLVRNVDSLSVTAGNGGAGSCFGGTDASYGGIGGYGYGIIADNYNYFYDIEIDDVNSGSAGITCEDDDGQNGNLGGIVYGFSVNNSNNFYNFTINSLDTGNGADAKDEGYGGDSMSVRLFEINNYNYFNGLEFYDMDAGQGGDCKGSGSDSPGRNGGLTFVDGIGNHFYNFIVQDFAAASPQSGCIDTGTLPYDVDLLFGADTILYNASFSSLRGSNGGDGDERVGKPGANIDITFLDSTIDYSSFYTLTGATGGNGDYNDNGGAGGSIVITLTNSSITNSSIYDLNGGTGGAGNTDPAGVGGNVIGLKFVGSNCSSFNVTLYDLDGGLYSSGGDPSTDGYSIAVYNLDWNFTSGITSDFELFNITDLYSRNSYEASFYGSQGSFDLAHTSSSYEGIRTNETNYVIYWYTNDDSAAETFSIYSGNETERNTLIDSDTKTNYCTNVQCSYSFDRTDVWGAKYFEVRSNIAQTSSHNNLSVSKYPVTFSDTIINEVSIGDNSSSFFIPSIYYINNTLGCRLNFSDSTSSDFEVNMTLGNLSMNEQEVTPEVYNYFNQTLINPVRYSTYYCNVTLINQNFTDILTGSDSITISNAPPSVPTIVYYWNGSTNLDADGATFEGMSTTFFEGANATDLEGDNLTYEIEITYNSLTNYTDYENYSNELNVSFYTPITELIFDVDFSLYNWTTGTITEYNVSVIDQETYVYNSSCVGRCPYSIEANTNSTDSTYVLKLNEVIVNSTQNSSIISSGQAFNATIDLINASNDWDFTLNFLKVYN